MANQLAQLWLLALTWVTLAGATPAAAPGPAETLKTGEFTVELNGIKLWYKVSGTGPVCLMPTPAWGPSSDLYFRTLKSMENLFTVVHIDSRGTGRSGRAKTAKQYTWDDLVADLDALRAHLKQETVWLMGHSEGGEQVLHYACKHPKRKRKSPSGSKNGALGEERSITKSATGCSAGSAIGASLFRLFGGTGTMKLCRSPRCR